MAFAPPDTVEGPRRVALRAGLLSVLSPSSEGDGRWQNGVQWEPLTCGPVSGIGSAECTPSGTAGTGLPKTFPEDAGVVEATAFSVYGSYLCSPIGHNIEYAQSRALQHLLAREEAVVERAFWTGDLDNTPNLQDSAVDVNSAGAVDPVEAIGLLEDQIASEYGSLGVIHMKRSAAITAVAAGALVWDGSLMTALGTPVVAGAGYPGSSPAGAAAATGESWIYGSPALFGYRSNIFYPTSRSGDLLDRDVNDLYGVAERSYLLGYDECGVGAVRMTLGCC